ncbi:hypothetical protein CCACVL1_22624 [Corchorus capsularis]|uniref:Uncharacterized protein n=1 Tax=Corchorus capsularis TaxID=210143 RepID=A0A1R3GXG6_COCAP|nr:hypothetical protein CCACVL1_22624 [Corchorus capsularis]
MATSCSFKVLNKNLGPIFRPGQA